MNFVLAGIAARSAAPPARKSRCMPFGVERHRTCSMSSGVNPRKARLASRAAMRRAHGSSSDDARRSATEDGTADSACLRTRRRNSLITNCSRCGDPMMSKTLIANSVETAAGRRLPCTWGAGVRWRRADCGARPAAGETQAQSRVDRVAGRRRVAQRGAENPSSPPTRSRRPRAKPVHSLARRHEWRRR